jgi:hypothetical protein
MRSVRAQSIAIIQSNYIPWKGYFDLMASVDRLVLYDVVQYTKNDWRNRNRIKTASGPLWLTIPVRHSGRFGQRIDETEVADQRWRARHWRTIEQAYRGAPYFTEYSGPFETLYLDSTESRLSAVNRAFLELLSAGLAIETPLADVVEVDLPEDRVERLVAVCEHFGATRYVSGPAAKAYLDEAVFARAGIAVEYFDYSGYPEYPQLYLPFEHSVSALDLLFNTGPDARGWMLVSARRPAT